MMTRHLLLWLLIPALLAQCKNPSQKDAARNQMQEVIAIHDEVMPEMSTIGKLVAEIKPRVDSSDSGKKFGKAMEDLQLAHQAMMTWMQGFGERFDSDEILNGKALTEQKQAWLDEEEEKVKAMREQVLNSIEQARNLLEASER